MEAAVIKIMLVNCAWNVDFNPVLYSPSLHLDHQQASTRQEHLPVDTEKKKTQAVKRGEHIWVVAIQRTRRPCPPNPRARRNM